MKFQFRIISLLILTIVAGVALTIWSQLHPRHGVYSPKEIETLLVDDSAFVRVANGSLVELKNIAMNEKFYSVRVVKNGSESYSEIPIDKAMELLAVLDKFDTANSLANSSEEVLALPPVGEFEIQYIVKKNRALQMPMSIEIVDESSLLVGYDFVTTTDANAKKTVSNLLLLVRKITDTNPYSED